MTTTVKVTAHSFPCTITQSDVVIQKGPMTLHETYSTKTIVLRDGQEWEGVVTNTCSVHVEELAADRDPPSE